MIATRSSIPNVCLAGVYPSSWDSNFCNTLPRKICNRAGEHSKLAPGKQRSTCVANLLLSSRSPIWAEASSSSQNVNRNRVGPRTVTQRTTSKDGDLLERATAKALRMMFRGWSSQCDWVSIESVPKPVSIGSVKVNCKREELD